MSNLFPVRALLLLLAPAWLLSLSCSTSVVVPPVEKIFPAASKPPRAAEPVKSVDFNLDGTLSMQGFARPSDGRFSQLLQDLDLSFSALWRPDQISYHRFGSIVEPVSQRPFYVAASNEGFFKSTKEYATTRIDKVFRASDPGRLTVVMTDLFEQDLDISSIQQSLRASQFPGRSSLAIWQWRMPFSGPIFDFDFRVREGRTYTGERYLYLLALGPKESLEKLRGSIDHTVSIGKPNYLLLPNDPAKNSADWLPVAQTANTALKTRHPGDAESAPYSVYRVSRGCSTAELTARPQLSSAAPGGNYQAELLALANNNGKWTSRRLADPDISSTLDRSGHDAVKIRVSCQAVTGSGIALLRVRRVGTGDDIVLPPWVAASSASSMQFNNALKQNQPDWGSKTLNLSPLVRGLANTATDQTTMAIAYIYFVAN
jgi:hypothetical protein